MHRDFHSGNFLSVSSSKRSASCAMPVSRRSPSPYFMEATLNYPDPKLHTYSNGFTTPDRYGIDQMSRSRSQSSRSSRSNSIVSRDLNLDYGSQRNRSSHTGRRSTIDRIDDGKMQVTQLIWKGNELRDRMRTDIRNRSNYHDYKRTVNVDDIILKTPPPKQMKDKTNWEEAAMIQKEAKPPQDYRNAYFQQTYRIVMPPNMSENEVYRLVV